MDLKTKLVKQERREDAGARASNRFAYQYYWAFNKLLELFRSENDFVLIIEFHDDIIILDNTEDPSSIDFYQIKSNNKKSQLNISMADITRTTVKEPVSFAEKLIDNLNRFPDETNSISFVSNKNFNFKLKDKNSKSKELLTISLDQIKDIDIIKFKDNVCKNCIHKNKCVENCLPLIYFNVSDLGINNYSDTVYGRFRQLFDELYPLGTNDKTKAMYHTILSELTRINNSEAKPTTYSELLSQKSITRGKLLEYLDEFNRSISNKDNWNEINIALTREGYSSIEILSIKKEYIKYNIDILGAGSPLLNKIIEDIRKIVLEANIVDYNSIREYIQFVLSQIKSQYYFKNKVFNKEYYIAIILGEIFYEG